MMWMDEASCREVDPELFFPDATSKADARQAEAAKLVCKGCPVIDHCLSWALETDQDEGIWGGQNLRERRRLKRRLVALVIDRPAA